MEFKQMELVLGPTSIEDLYYYQEVDNDILAEAMLLNWEDHGSLVGKDESWKLLTELGDDFIFDDILNEYDSYRGTVSRTLVIKIKDRYFAYYYIENSYDADCFGCEEVKPIPAISYEVKYIPPFIDTELFVEKSKSYTKIFDQ